MNTVNTHSAAASHTLSLQRKISGVIWVLRSLALVYTYWVLQHMVSIALEGDDYLKRVGGYWNKDLLAGEAWQFWSTIGLNFFLWVGLALAVGCFWRASVHMLRDMGVSSRCGHWLRLGAWWGLSAAVLGILTRPLWSYLLTLHLSQPLWSWRMMPSDLLGVIVCAVLLLLSYLVIWMSEIAEENKAFV